MLSFRWTWVTPNAVQLTNNFNVMGYGQTDRIVELEKALADTVGLLVGVAMGTKTQAEVRTFLEKEYPEECVTKEPAPEPKKKW